MSKFLKLIIGLAVIVAGYLVFTKSSGVPITPTVPSTPDVETYKNQEYGFELVLPKDFQVTKSNLGSAFLALLPDKFYQNNNLREARVEVAVGKAAECSITVDPQVKTILPSSISVSGHDFKYYSSSEGAAGSIYTTEGYTRVIGGRCYNIFLLTRSINLGVLEKPVPLFDPAIVESDFEKVVRTFSIKN